MSEIIIGEDNVIGEDAAGNPVTQSQVKTAAEAIERLDKEITEEHVSKEPIPSLPPLLEQRRKEYCIPDEMFTVSAVFDRLFVFQISDRATDYYTSAEEVMIHKPQTTADRELHESPRGIIVSAGMGARDQLLSNGMDVGHVIRFIQHVPYRMVMGMASGIELKVLMMRCGDLTASEDLMRELKSRRVRIKAVEREVDGVVVREHVYIDADGKTWNPQQPFIGDDY